GATHFQAWRHVCTKNGLNYLSRSIWCLLVSAPTAAPPTPPTTAPPSALPPTRELPTAPTPAPMAPPERARSPLVLPHPGTVSSIADRITPIILVFVAFITPPFPKREGKSDHNGQSPFRFTSESMISPEWLKSRDRHCPS